eukprot:364247-Chlamydomonas_euryale.AAC.22
MPSIRPSPIVRGKPRLRSHISDLRKHMRRENPTAPLPTILQMLIMLKVMIALEDSTTVNQTCSA